MTSTNTGRLLGRAGIVAGAVALLALTWFGTLDAVRTQYVEAEARVAANVVNNR
jgi:hypothetical protein